MDEKAGMELTRILETAVIPDFRKEGESPEIPEDLAIRLSS